MTGHNSPSGPSNINIERDRNLPNSNSPSVYSYGYQHSILTNEAEASLNASPGAELSATRSGQPNGISPRSPSFFSAPPINDPTGEQRQTLRRFPNPLYIQEFDLDGGFSQNSILLNHQGGQTPLPPPLDQNSIFIQNETNSKDDFSNLYINDRTIPMPNPSPLPDSYRANPGTPFSYFPVGASMPEVSRYDYEDSEFSTIQQGVWSYGPSTSDENHSEANMTVPYVSIDQENQVSHFFSREEIPTSSPVLPLHCDLCDPPTFHDNENYYRLHYWDEHAPPPGSPEGWQPRRCFWDECTFEKEFSTSRTWVDHAYIVHHRRFPCTFEGCTFTKAFGSKHSLIRHMRTMHEEPELCKIRGCQGNKTKLCRKDKKNEHNANFHGPLVCIVSGCNRGRIDDQDHGFSDPNELNKHIQKKHRFLRSRERVFETERSELD